MKKETIDEKSVGPRLPRKKGPKPKRIRRIILKPLTEDEEDSLLDNLDASIQERKQNDDPILARMRRKLALRQLKREKDMRTWDLDVLLNNLLAQKRKQLYFDCTTDIPVRREPEYKKKLRLKRENELGGYDGDGAMKIEGAGATAMDGGRPPDAPESQDSLPSTSLAARPRRDVVHFKERLMGENLFRKIVSPYTGRPLLPYIRRDFESRTPKLRLLEELMVAHRKRSCRPDANKWYTREMINTVRASATAAPSIDYTYLKPALVGRVNRLLCEEFWPGIDVSECTEYPDFTVVALYKSMVVGAAFMTPEEAYVTYIAVHPEWRGAGIATFMMYHLIQTCPGKDVMLHVSATNDAVILYQKLGFKPEEFLVDFYKKYYPDDSPICKHAFLMRLRR